MWNSLPIKSALSSFEGIVFFFLLGLKIEVCSVAERIEGSDFLALITTEFYFYIFITKAII